LKHVAASLRAVLVYVRTMLAFAIIWHVAALAIGNRALLPAPLAVAEALNRAAWAGEILEHVGISLARMLIAVFLATGLALPLGVAMGLDRRIENFVDPLVEILRPISGIAWIPLALFLFGIGHTLPIYIMFYAALFPILIGTIAGVRGVDRRLIDAARTMGVALPRIILRVVMPAATPAILVAMRLGVASSWTSVIAAELVGAPSGLGYAIQWYREMLVTSRMMAFIFLVGLCGYLCDAALRALQRRLTPWAPREVVLA
jgi:ABC-type nitrate/sulfonate/bicarbonate transport system permease component